MEQEEKQLLLQDLCARLPYCVKVYAYYEPTGEWFDAELEGIDYTNKEVEYAVQYIDKKCPYAGCTTKLKPYLRPMSSMTKDEIKEFDKFCVIDEYAWSGGSIQGFINQAEIMQNGIDWLNAHHFDYRGLIEKGLALEAPEGMYN